MNNPTISFNNGSTYEQYMGKWSQLAGNLFLDWLKPKSNLSWLDIGCGNGAFTEILIDRCAPKTIDGIDPSSEQLIFASARPKLHGARFKQGDAMALPYPDQSFEMAVMPLVLFFVPVPAKGLKEMLRVVSPGGTVSAYVWDLLGGGFPYAVFQEEMKAMGATPIIAPSAEISQMDALKKLWNDSGLVNIDAKEITVQRTYANFEAYWSIAIEGPSIGATLATLKPEQIELLKSQLRRRLSPNSSGQITLSARANAIQGLVPK